MNPSFYMKTNLQYCSKKMGFLPFSKVFSKRHVLLLYKRDALKDEAYVVCFANAIMIKFIEALGKIFVFFFNREQQGLSPKQRLRLSQMGFAMSGTLGDMTHLCLMLMGVCLYMEA